MSASSHRNCLRHQPQSAPVLIPKMNLRCHETTCPPSCSLKAALHTAITASDSPKLPSSSRSMTVRHTLTGPLREGPLASGIPPDQRNSPLLFFDTHLASHQPNYPYPRIEKTKRRDNLGSLQKPAIAFAISRLRIPWYSIRQRCPQQYPLAVSEIL